ncbi:MAG: hypothetical protein WAW39_03945 [Prosthecobacter sp.]|uniref:hypothetical protein n=1 Tax=Prosthecobacter sp. TaxID=1965333 RepID=UPI003BB1AEB6
MKTTAIIIAILSLAALTCCHKKPKDTRLPEPEVRKEKAAHEASARPHLPDAAPIPVIAVPPAPTPAAVPVPAPPPGATAPTGT